MTATTSYVDIGAVQRKEGGSPSANTSYVDIGAVQRLEAAPGGGANDHQLINAGLIDRGLINAGLIGA